jgi:hypothetical protein
MDKNKFWLGGRLFNTTSPRLVAPMQHKARPQFGHPTHVHNANARNVCTSVGWAPQRHARRVRKMGTQTQHKVRPQVRRPNASQGTSASWAPQRTSTMQTQGTYAMQGTSGRPQIGCRNATQGTSTRWSPKCKTHPQQKRTHKGALG